MKQKNIKFIAYFNMIRGGYYIKARCIQESEIAHAPPHVREIWDWFLREANHRDRKRFKRGEMMRSIRDIQEGLSWYIGYRKMVYKKHHCEFALYWLRKHEMIETAKTTRGMLITVCKYATYQDPASYESGSEKGTNETTLKQGPDTINKNVKNVNNKKENKEARKNKFYSLLTPFLKKYDKKMIRAFYDYWTESNQAGKKMRFEMEKVFDSAKRLATWERNEAKFGKKHKKGDFPNKYDAEYAKNLSGDRLMAYWKHLKKLGFKPVYKGVSIVDWK